MTPVMGKKKQRIRVLEKNGIDLCRHFQWLKRIITNIPTDTLWATNILPFSMAYPELPSVL